MKKIIFAGSCFSLGIGLLSCGGAHGDEPGHAYMPDMYYSRAYEAYGYNMVDGAYDSLKSRGIHYNGLTVAGTVARSEALPTHLTGDSAGMRAANELRNPFDTTTAIVAHNNTVPLKDAERLYLVNCGVCHGPALDGNGPLYKGGEGPYPAAPRPLNGDYAKKLTDGSIFYTITFGKGAMGSYASQLRPEQRWAVVSYIRSRQTPGPAGEDSTTNAANAAAAQADGGMQQAKK